MKSIKTYNFQNFTTEVCSAGMEEVSRLDGDLFLFDTNTSRLINTSGLPLLTIPAGEEHKQWSTVESILDTAFEYGLDRSSLISGIGGGVLCDMTAFASSLYMRGCRLRLVPTTLLAMVDAAFGGKTGVDHLGFKNSVGTFYPASQLVIIPEFIKTLPEKQFKNGMGEVIKTAMLGDPELFDILKNRSEEIKNRDMELLKYIVFKCVAVKGRIVEEDLKESGVRAHLNWGHTFAHGLETVSDFTIEHGEAVGWGIFKALEMGQRLGITNAEYKKQSEELLSLYGFSSHITHYNADEVLEAMKKDKKRRGDDIRFILQSDLCKTSIRSVEPDIILDVLKD